jgi:serine/threonine protein kinase
MAYTRGTVLRTAFDTYTIRRKRGGGSSGEVFEVLDSDRTPRALKVLEVTKTSQHGLRRSKDEFNFAFRTPHRNIAPLLDCGITGSKAAFVVMPLYAASLRDWIRDWIKEGIAPENVLRFFGYILDGLEAAHLHGVRHGAIRPENIFASDDGKELLIADFGIAQLLESSRKPSKSKAAASKAVADKAVADKAVAKAEPANPYAAPEQHAATKAATKATVDEKADVYALGILLREMFLGTTEMGLGHPDIGDVAPNFAYLDWTVGRMTNPEPSRRPSVSEVKRELIARGHEFLSLQRLNALKTEILRESEPDDPLVRNPIAIQAVDFKGDTLYLTLSTVPPTAWVQAFHAGDTDPRAGHHGPNRFIFLGRLAHMKIGRGLDPAQLLEFAKIYVAAANRLYAETATAEYRHALEAEREKRRAMIAAEERRHAVLSRLRL